MGKYKVTTDQGTYIVTTEDQQPDWKGVVGSAVKSSIQKPFSYAKNLATNPETMSKALPAVMGTAGAVAFPFGGGTGGTALGQGIRDVSLKALQKPIPGLGQHAMELGSAMGGDILSGLLQKGYYGSQIGKSEVAAGLKNIEKEAPPSGMRTAVKYIQALKNKMNASDLSPQEARSIKPALDTIQQKGWLKGTEYSSDLYDVHNRIKNIVNRIPGRAEASSGLARTMTIPNKVGQAWGSLPRSVKYGLGVGGGATAPIGIYEILKKLLGGSQ